jgi:hypothetical protein
MVCRCVLGERTTMTTAIGRRGFMIGGAALAASGAGLAYGQDLPRVRVGSLQFGTVNWELAVIRDGLDRPPPLLGWVFRDSWAAANPELARGFLDASFAAKAVMKTDDAVWQRLRPEMRAEDDTVFAALRDGYRAGIPAGPGPADAAAAGIALRLMAAITPAAVGGLKALPSGTFWAGYGG